MTMTTKPFARWSSASNRSACFAALSRLATLASAALLAGCASTPSSQVGNSPLYRCEHSIDFTARFVDDSVILDSTRGYEVLLRDAGGMTPQQTVYSNTRVKAEFGLGESGGEAVLHYPLLSLVARCARESAG